MLRANDSSGPADRSNEVELDPRFSADRETPETSCEKEGADATENNNDLEPFDPLCIGSDCSLECVVNEYACDPAEDKRCDLDTASNDFDMKEGTDFGTDSKDTRSKVLVESDPTDRRSYCE